MDSKFNESYVGGRPDILRLVPFESRRILDVGCSIGILGKEIKLRQEAEVVGVESNCEMAAVAKDNLDRIYNADAESFFVDNILPTEYFDCIIFADILEHLKNPWAVLVKAQKLLNNHGVIIASIPNVRHFSTLLSLFVGIWPYRDRGIHDRTHLRFFTLNNIRELFVNAGLKIVKLEKKFRIIEAPNNINRISFIFLIFPLNDFFVFQYLIVSRKLIK